MKKIEAFVRHESFDSIRRRLFEEGMPSMSISDVKGSGRQAGITEHYRGAELVIHLRPKLKIEMVVPDDAVNKVVDAILEFARTGEVGDGKIFILPVDDAIRVRTGERGDVVMETHESQAGD
ncbi:MAG: P-II family nitrogen regulator [Solirubrobacterales bacterium]